MRIIKAIYFLPLALFIFLGTATCSARNEKNTAVVESDGSDDPERNDSGVVVVLPQDEVPLAPLTTLTPVVLTGETPMKDTVNTQPQQSPSRHIPVNMALIPGGSFQMGDSNGDIDEAPSHPVRVDPFYMGKRQVSQQEYSAIMGGNPSGFKGNNLPVENVSWFDAVEYCNRLSAQEGLPPAYRGEGAGITCDFAAASYRLPTEAEWEYAARGGQENTRFAGTNDANAAGWYNANSGGMTGETGAKAANGFGLHDMSGNVWEWCWDWYGKYADNEQTNPRGNAEGKVRVVRGGGWGNNEWNLRVSARNSHSPLARNSSVGFRVARPVLSKEN